MGMAAAVPGEGAGSLPKPSRLQLHWLGMEGVGGAIGTTAASAAVGMCGGCRGAAGAIIAVATPAGDRGRRGNARTTAASASAVRTSFCGDARSILPHPLLESRILKPTSHGFLLPSVTAATLFLRSTGKRTTRS